MNLLSFLTILKLSIALQFLISTAQSKTLKKSNGNNMSNGNDNNKNNSNRYLKKAHPTPEHTRAKHEKKLQNQSEQLEQQLQEEHDSNNEISKNNSDITPEDEAEEVAKPYYEEDEEEEDVSYEQQEGVSGGYQGNEISGVMDNNRANNNNDLCTQASTCNECLLQDTIVSAQNYSCEWKKQRSSDQTDNPVINYGCAMVPSVMRESNGAQKLFTCDDTKGRTSISSYMSGDGDNIFEEHTTSIIMVIMFVTFIGIGIRMKSKKDKILSSNSNPNLNDNTYSSSNMFRNNNNGAMRFRQTETIPLTMANNEEEWGWEDDTNPSPVSNRIDDSIVTTTTTTMKPYKDIEMVQPQATNTSLNNDSISANIANDDDELQKAIALSLESKKITSS